MTKFCRERGKTLYITLHVQPRSKKTAIVGVHGDALKVKVAAPPVDGAANEALVKYFSKFLSLPKSKIEIMQGEGSKFKVIAIVGVSESEFTSLLIKEGLLVIQIG